jgi:hypothetical protein
MYYDVVFSPTFVRLYGFHIFSHIFMVATLAKLSLDKAWLGIKQHTIGKD